MDDVLEMAEMLLRTRNTDALALVQTVEALAAEVRELRAKLDSEASHRLSLCADNERFVAENAELRADLVWSVKHGAFLDHEIEDEPAVFAWFVFGFGGEPEMEKCDGTPESICRAVREARDGTH